MTRKILLVEDNPTDEKLTLRAFAKCGLREEIAVVRDGAEAIEYLHGTARHEGRYTGAVPRVVLLDLRLPRVGGLEVLERVRAHTLTHLVPVVVLTASGEHEDIERAYTLGANAYLRKPVDFSEFVQIAEAIGRFWLQFNVPPVPQRVAP